MKVFWRSKSALLAAILAYNFCLLDLSFSWSLSEEGVALLSIKEKIVSDPHGALSSWVDEVGVESPCSWFGVGCTDGHVVVLNLKDLRLKGTLAPQVGNLLHLKSIVLRNNSFVGIIPEEIVKLEELEVLDVGYNNFSGHLPDRFSDNLSTTTLSVDNNEFLVIERPKPYVFGKLSKARADEGILSRGSLLKSRNPVRTRNMAGRALLQERPIEGRPYLTYSQTLRPPGSNLTSQQLRRPGSNNRPLLTSREPPPSPSPSPTSPSPSPTSPSPSPPSNNNRTFPTAVPAPGEPPRQSNTSGSNRELILLGAIGGPVLLALIVLGAFCYRTGKMVSVKPWGTGLSGPLRKAFVTGVQKLKRSVIEAACEDFSNVIGSSSVCTFYKGTLSNGVEITVVSIAATSAKEWSSDLEAQFRNKIDTLSKVSHKNFASLLGYCDEDEPFTRMMVFEYAPNGTIFEHIHMREAEHLDWPTRLRIAMGMAYCLEHMHQLEPPLTHRNLTSSSVYLTEDYAAKISDFALWDGPGGQTGPVDNVYSFGVVLFEMMTGRLPFSAGGGSGSGSGDWAADYLSREDSLSDAVDPTLCAYEEDRLMRIGEVVRACVEPDPRRRPSMGEVCERLSGATGIGRDAAVPRLSPLWWAELEIRSNDVS